MDNFVTLLSEALERDDEINPTDCFREYVEWDSLSALSVLAAVNEEFGIIIPRVEFEKQVTVEDLFTYIKGKVED